MLIYVSAFPSDVCFSHRKHVYGCHCFAEVPSLFKVASRGLNECNPLYKTLTVPHNVNVLGCFDWFC